MDDELAAAARQGRADIAHLIAHRKITSLKDAVTLMFRQGLTSIEELIPMINSH